MIALFGRLSDRFYSILLVVMLVGVLFSRFQLDPQIDPDLFARLATGRLILEAGSIPQQDIFSFVPTKPLWVDHEWLSAVVFYQLYERGGELALYLFKIFLAALTFVFLLSAQKVVTGRDKPATSDLLWMIILGCFVSLVWHTTIRSQVFTYLFLAFELYAIVRHSHDGEWLPLATMIFAMPVWANCHGGFVVGLGFLGIHALCCRNSPRRMLTALLILSASLCATLLNPYGIDYWYYIIEAVTMKRELIREWAPVSLISGEAVPLNLLVVVLVGSFYMRRKKPPLESTLLMLVSLYFAYRHFRFIPIPLMVGIVFSADTFRDVASKLIPLADMAHGRLIGRLLVLATVFWGWFCAARLFSNQEPFSLSYRLFPRDAVTWIEHERTGGNILSSYRVGNYLLWRLYPRFKVAIDGRYEEVYTDEVFRRSYDALDPRREGHRAALDSLNPDLILIDRRALRDIEATSYGQRYSEVYRDQNYSVFEQQQSINQDK